MEEANKNNKKQEIGDDVSPMIHPLYHARYAPCTMRDTPLYHGGYTLLPMFLDRNPLQRDQWILTAGALNRDKPTFFEQRQRPVFAQARNPELSYGARRQSHGIALEAGEPESQEDVHNSQRREVATLLT